ncbi:MAG: hypothetical protein LIO62_07770, partial [Clostridiales bacterium]|nr:hypothetical protein [Clostridiales bacterium]
TFDKEKNMAFIDISIYKNFVKKYGNPGICIISEADFDKPVFDTNGKISYDELNAESILKIYGYAVNKNDNLSSSKRQELLAEIIDLDIMSASRISNFLKLLINKNKRYPIAQVKWKEDKKFVENYKANQQRFLIVKD